jgi:hypothetical protein
MKKIFKLKNVQWIVKSIKENTESLKFRTAYRGYFLLIICIPLFFASCSSAKIFTKPDAMSYTMRHKTLAILPPRAYVEIKKKDNLENRQAQAMTESVNAQNEIYSRFLDFVQKDKIYVDIQAVEKTNATFIETGYPYDMPPDELSKALGVDAILYTDCVFSSEHHVANGIAIAILLFPYGTVLGIMEATMPTNYVDINMRLYDGTTSYLLFSYNDKFGGLNTKHIVLIDKATKKIVKKSPYYRK